MSCTEKLMVLDQGKFLAPWIEKGLACVLLDGTTDAEAEATSYTKKMEDISASILPRDAAGMPLFDLMLIGVGLDGHIGSLYPDSPQVLQSYLPYVWPSSSSLKLASVSRIAGARGEDVGGFPRH